ncbi:MAG: AhpC/TSA family protein [Bacteroidetes bacterium]|nr:MAG: AhpC/TSA family protein [Bacteroidota bacterium]
MKQILIFLTLIFMITTLKSQTDRNVQDAQGLGVGADAPLFRALDADSNEFSLSETLKEQTVVLIFYRGFWCPVCNKHLSALQDSLKLIEETGAKVIAISPEKPEYLDKMAQKSGAEFTLLCDEDYKIADAYDVTFKPTSMQLFTYNTLLGGKLKKTHSDESQRLPVPATFIINQKGIIVWRQFNPDYKKRASVDDILKALSRNGVSQQNKNILSAY